MTTIRAFRVAGIRCFDDTQLIELSNHCNIFVGQNNAGKSTLLKAVLSLQGMPFSPADYRKGSRGSFVQALTESFGSDARLAVSVPLGMPLDVMQGFSGEPIAATPAGFTRVHATPALFQNTRPTNAIVPFLAKRKAVGFAQDVSQAAQIKIDGTYSNLYARIDNLAVYGRPNHESFARAVEEVVGLKITTAPSSQGKEAGFFLGEEFVTLDRMGDGVSEMVALIAELCIEKNKIFVLEEPETNLHPRGLKALLKLIRNSRTNQFIIATHSNIVVRELASEQATRVFRVSRDEGELNEPSKVDLIENSPAARSSLLRELGYEFVDFDIHEGWLFLEESSAESVIRDVLIPRFAPELAGRIRTFSAGGANNVEPSVSEFQRLITFVHLQPVYQDRIWVRADGDEAGRGVVERIREKFSCLANERCQVFSKPDFENYYPSNFSNEAMAALAISDKKQRQNSKAALLKRVLEWTAQTPGSTEEWRKSAPEVIAFLEDVKNSIK